MADKDIPAIRALADRVSAEALYKEAEEIVSDDPVLLRNMKIYLAKRFTEKRLKEIGDEFGIGESAVSQVCRRLSARIVEDKKLKKSVAEIIRKLRL